MKICTAPVNQSNDSKFVARFDANRPIYKPQYLGQGTGTGLQLEHVRALLRVSAGRRAAHGTACQDRQTKDEVIFLYPQQGASPSDFRVIPTDGRPHDPVKSQDLLYYGHAVGKWEGDTLVVDAVGFNDITWLAQGGYFHSNEMRVIERFRRDGNTLHYQATVIDPEALLEPWVMNPRVLRLNTNKNAAIPEQNPCEERDLEHLVGKIRH